MISRFHLCLLLFLIERSASYRSINLASGFSGSTMGVPPVVWANMDDVMLEARVHNYDAAPLEYRDVFDVFGFALKTYGNQFLLLDGRDKIPDGLGTGVFLDVSQRGGDVLIRLGRSGDTFFSEIWNTATAGDYATKTLPISVVAKNFTNAQVFIGSAPTTAQIAWIRFYSTSVRGSAKPPSPLQNDGLLASWNFEDNLTDSGPQQLHFSTNGAATYSNTPSYTPVASIDRVGAPYWAPAISARVGATVELDGSRSYPLGNERSLSYSWSQIDGPDTIDLSSSTDAIIQLVPTAFGTYTIKLTVTESDTSATDNVVFSFGAVRTDSHGAIIPEDPKVSLLFGPLIIWGESPWPWLDERNFNMIEQFLWHTENNPNFNGEDFMTSLPGTISVTSGSKIVTGIGTDFQNSFCDGSTSPARKIIIWYKYGENTGRRRYDIQSCDSATQLTLGNDYVTTENQSGLEYSLWLCDGCWLGGGTNINYYDNVITLYSFYYRTGQDRYLQKARELALKWARSPVIDSGKLWEGGDEVYKRSAPRVVAMLGITWSAYEQNDEFLWSTVKTYNAAFGNYYVLFDVRENAYELGYLALSALLSPDEAYVSECLAKVNASLYTRWLPTRNSEGMWELMTYGYASWNGYPGTAAVTKGSTQVIGTDTTWQAAWAQGGLFYIAGDPVAYPDPIVVSTTEVTLSRPYEGETATGKSWQMNNIVGTTIVPFQIGLAGQMFYLAYEATQDENARDLVMNSAIWITEKGIQQSTKALYYARGGPTCEPISDSNKFCAFNPEDTYSIWAARFLNGEVFGLLSRAMVLEPDNEVIRSAGDLLISSALGKMGGPGADDFWAEELTEFTSTNSTKFKNVGFFFGTGFSPSWPAARLGPSPPSDNGNTPSTNGNTPDAVVSASSQIQALTIVLIAVLCLIL